MLRPLSRGEVESMLAGDKPGVNKEVVRKVLLEIHIHEIEASAVQAINFAEAAKIWTPETIRVIRQGIEKATVKS
jgi:hypothetical protein